MVFVRAPVDLAGMGFLQWTNAPGSSTQWLYSPGLKRVRPLGEETKSQGFLGSDLTFRELEIVDQYSAWSEDDVRATLVGEEEVDGMRCHVVRLEPKLPTIGYDTITIWAAMPRFDTKRIQLESARGGRKVLSIGDGRDVGGIPTPHHYEMTDAV
jgi:hypothetical protein